MWSTSRAEAEGDSAPKCALPPEGRGLRHRPGQFDFRFDMNVPMSPRGASTSSRIDVSVRATARRTLELTILAVTEKFHGPSAKGDQVLDIAARFRLRPLRSSLPLYMHLDEPAIWIIGEIDVTPFLAVAVVASCRGRAVVHLHCYCVKDRWHGPCLAELEQIAAAFIFIVPRILQGAGRLTADQVRDTVIRPAACSMKYPSITADQECASGWL